MKSLYNHWYKDELIFEIPDVLSGDKEGKIRYKYCKYFLQTYFRSIDLLPEFFCLRKYIKQILNIDVYGVLVNRKKVLRDNSYRNIYLIGTLNTSDIHKVDLFATDDKLLQISEYIKKITEESGNVICSFVNSAQDLKWMFLVDAIDTVKHKYSDRLNIYDISINCFREIDVIFNFDEDLIRCQNGGIVEFLADEIRSEYNKHRSIELKSEDLSISFTSFETESERMQKPYKEVKRLFDGHGLWLNREESKRVCKPVIGDELLYLNTIIDARGYTIIEGKWHIQLMDKNNDVLIEPLVFVYPPNTEINESNWYEYAFVTSEHEDYPKCTVIINM